MAQQYKTKQDIPVWHKYLLTLNEAAAYFGIGRKRLDAFLLDHQDEFCILVGNRTLVKRAVFEKYLDERVTVI